MSTERFQRVKEIFHAALERRPEERSPYLDEACRDDPSLRAEVEAMLAADHESDEFMEAMMPEEAGADPLRPSLLGARIGQYELKRIISTGGMGTVYEAVQENPRRTVAVKVMREGLLSASSLRRFEHEARILANLHHPGIAQIFESGTYTPGDAPAQAPFPGVPYFVMEYIPDARDLTEYAKEKKLDLNARLQLFLNVLEAVHHGHQKGIIHRDLKPANILVDGNGHVKIIDFGVARATDSDLMLTTQQTGLGQLIGTVQYMSPEQCRADPNDLDIRSDVYALGVVLYELLCGKLPYDLRNTSLLEATRRVLEEHPARPSTALRMLRGDPETIVLKALEKERERRYASAEAMRRDMECYLRGEPIAARPPSALYQLKFFARRNKALVSGVAAAFVALVIGLIVSLTLYVRSEEARKEALVNEKKAKSVNAFFNEMLISSVPNNLYRISGYGLGEDLAPRMAVAGTTDLKVSEMLRNAISSIKGAFTGQPELEATVRSTIGTAFIGHGLYTDAREQLRKAWEIRCACLGKDHPDTLRTQMQLGAMLCRSFKLDKAEPLLRSALERLQSVLGEKDPDTLACMRILAVTLSYRGKTVDSDRLFKKTLDYQAETMGQNKRERVYTLVHWSMSLFLQRRFLDMRDRIREAYDLSRSHLAPEDPLTLISEMLLALLMDNRGDVSGAMSMIEKTLDKCRYFFPEDHFHIFDALHLKACILRGEDCMEEQEHLLRVAKAGFQKTFGLESLWTNAAFTELWLQLWNRGRLPEAEQVIRERLDECRSALGENHPSTLSARRELGNVLLAQGRFEEGEEQYRKWVSNLERIHGKGSGSVLKILQAIAEILHEAGRHESARVLADHALETGRKRLDSDEATFMDMQGFAHLLLTCEPDDLRDPAAALPLAQEAMELSQGKVIPCLETLALAYSMHGDHAEAVVLMQKAVALLPPGETENRWALETQQIKLLLQSGDTQAATACMKADHDRLYEELCDGPLVFERYVADGLMFLEEGRFDLAEPLLLKALSMPEHSFWWPPLRMEAMKGLIKICEAGGREEEAAVWKARFEKRYSWLGP